ncbi:hypothetical protein GCM10027443_35930 [Pontibacter brevis]
MSLFTFSFLYCITILLSQYLIFSDVPGQTTPTLRQGLPAWRAQETTMKKVANESLDKLATAA